MKKSNYYGVEMNGIEEMKFNKYLANNKIAMNTLVEEDRHILAKEWLKNFKQKLTTNLNN